MTKSHFQVWIRTQVNFLVGSKIRVTMIVNLWAVCNGHKCLKTLHRIKYNFCLQYFLTARQFLLESRKIPRSNMPTGISWNYYSVDKTWFCTICPFRPHHWNKVELFFCLENLVLYYVFTFFFCKKNLFDWTIYIV